MRESQKRASARYDAKATKQIKMKLNMITDADILERLDEVDNKQGYIKELIRRDISRGSDEKGYSGRRYSRENRMSYARGDGRRDSRGRYSRDYSYDESMIEELRELMEDAPDEKTKMEFKKFIRKMESM